MMWTIRDIARVGALTHMCTLKLKQITCVPLVVPRCTSCRAPFANPSIKKEGSNLAYEAHFLMQSGWQRRVPE